MKSMILNKVKELWGSLWLPHIRNDMYVIVGLGNPEKKYEGTRHNVGFICIDKIADKYGIEVSEAKFKALIGKGTIEGQKVILVKPLTYMNLSGESLRQVVDYYKVDPATEVCVIYDDTSMDVGKLRIRKKGSAGGHNGIKSIIANLASRDEFVRIKVGIGEKPPKYDLADYVLGHFTDDERKIIDEAADKVCQAVGLLANGEVDKAMNSYNG